MNAYSEDLRKKIVEALRRGAGKSETARLFGVSLSSVKRYAKLDDDEGRSLAPRKRPSSPPKIGTDAKRLLEADLEERPAATLEERREFLGRVARVSVSRATVSRTLRRLGWSRKKDHWERARRVLEGGLASAGGQRSRGRRRAAGVRGRDGLEHGALGALRVGTTGRASVRERAAQPRQEHYLAGEHES